ncbi:hypothetical protein ACQ86G_21505 [Roseateles chitinivorans]|uniref:hypothetical protein n=1 Tax=Roseateles chitinivorans TaxID=2917965 RepID=UPI003D66D324
MDFTTTLKAGVPLRQGTAGRMLMILDTGAAGSIAVRISIPLATDEEISQARKGFKARLTGAIPFDSVTFTSPVDTTIRYVISNNDIDFDLTDGATVKAEIQGLPLPVSNDRGSPGNLLYVSGVSLSDAPATAAANNGPVACSPVAVVVAAASANRRALRIANIGPDPVAIGAAGITWAKRCVVLEVGDIWLEDRGANLAWSAITDAGKTASVNVQEVTA